MTAMNNWSKIRFAKKNHPTIKIAAMTPCFHFFVSLTTLSIDSFQPSDEKI